MSRGQLKYTADLTPDNLDPGPVPVGIPSPNTNFRPLYANDIIYGGLGNDSIHSGAGDDAILGGEAPGIPAYVTNYDQDGNLVQVNNNSVTESDFAHPFNPGNPLGFKSTVANPTQLSKDMGKFALYDATSDPHLLSDPLRKIMLTTSGTLSKTGPTPSATNLTWFLDFNANEGPIDTFWVAGTRTPGVATDGDDRIFGDLGNDWVVGGTGRDAMFPGWGNDLVNADDNLETNGGLNNRTDTNPSYNDLVYGGAGLDVLIANTGGDRMDDFVGEFNSFYVPYSNFGLPTVQRLPNPGLIDFLLQVAKNDGADLSLAAQYSAASTRNGEPFGELGMVLQQDDAWQSNLGSPRDSQAGNLQNKADTTDNGLPIQQVVAAAAPYSTAVATITQDELDSIVAAAKHAVDHGTRCRRPAACRSRSGHRPCRQPAERNARRDDRYPDRHRPQRPRLGLVRRPDAQRQQRVRYTAVEGGVGGEPIEPGSWAHGPAHHRSARVGQRHGLSRGPRP